LKKKKLNVKKLHGKCDWVLVDALSTGSAVYRKYPELKLAFSEEKLRDCVERQRQAFKEALGDKIGIRRYGFFFLPMDESLARVVVDVGGRPHLVYEANAPTMFVRDFNIVLVKEFCRAFSNALGANLHVQLIYGEEPHHVAEAIFKGLARALDAATQIELRAADQLPSTKGKI
jgi:imidazoleglycerol phosphate dehydratase HisB